MPNSYLRRYVMLEKILAIAISAVIMSMFALEALDNWSRWERSVSAEKQRREYEATKEAAFIAEFEGLRIYAMPDGVLVEED
jgi:5'-deoxynucleotidase YfbR-like HD superfamily hydrolase